MRLPKIFLLFSLIATLEAAWVVWLKQGTLAQFVFAQNVRNVSRMVDDAINAPITNSAELLAMFHESLDFIPAEDYLERKLSRWSYTADWLFWDVPTAPLIASTREYGDCDDYARLSAYVLHHAGYGEVYFVSIQMDDAGHAVAIYFDAAHSSYRMADINGWSALHLVQEKQFPKDIYTLVQTVYPTTRFVAIDSWDLQHNIAIAEVRKKHEPTFPVD